MSELITCDVTDGVATLTLNRPRAINALTLEMIQGATEQLLLWSTDDAVTSVELRGAGERGFCSGADVRELATAMREGQDWVYGLRQEYGLQSLLSHYPKPTTAHLYGITMGGGLGTGAAVSRRLVDSTSVMAMPETKIGWFPDAGMMFWLSRAGAVGTHCALTSATFGAGDALHMNIADESTDGETAAPLHDADWIKESYSSDDAVEIARRLEEHSHPDAQTAARDLRRRSPFAVHVALRKLRESMDMSHDEVLARDLELSPRVLDVDFAEGVRALLVDKDNQPRWQHERLEDVPQQMVDDVFAV